MHARVVRFEGGDADAVRAAVEDTKSRAATGPPEGVPAVGFLLLHSADEGKVMGISLFETEEDLKQGDAALNAMDPPPVAGNIGQRTSVEFYELGVKAGDALGAG
jgi:hypothetical protein